MTRWLIIRNLILAVLVVGFVAYVVDVTTMVPPPPPKRWAVIKAYHAVWDARVGKINNSIKIEKQACNRVLMDKSMRLAQGNDVVQVLPILINGRLGHLIQEEKEAGEFTFFDLAAPRQPLTPGRYLITVVAVCDNPGMNPVERRTEAASASIVVK